MCAIAHIRRLWDGELAHNKLHESPAHFAKRMQQVADHLHSPEVAAFGGKALMCLAQELRNRCAEVVKRQGGGCPSQVLGVPAHLSTS